MPNPQYERALQRSDLSQWVVHFVRSSSMITPNCVGDAGEALDSIFRDSCIRPSFEHIAQYCADGAACFYDAPPRAWPEIAETNPSGRQPIGFIFRKTELWHLGGRPVIYTDLNNPDFWPESERYRIVYTNLSRLPDPADWTHEREWRIGGPLKFHQPQWAHQWWCPVVPTNDWANYLFRKYTGYLNSIYVIELNGLVHCRKNSVQKVLHELYCVPSYVRCGLAFHVT